MAKTRRSVDAEIIHDGKKATPGNEIVTVCSTCPAGKALVRTVARRVKKALGVR